MVFIDLEKAYDMVPLQWVWSRMREQSVPVFSHRNYSNTHEDYWTQVKSSV